MASVPELTKRSLLDGRIAGDDALGQVGLGCGGSAEAGRVARGPLDGLDRRRKRVAQDHRAPGAEVVDVAIAVGVDEVGALGALDKRRRAAHRFEGAHRRVDAAGKEALGALLEGLGPGADAGWEIWSHAGFSIEGAHLNLHSDCV